MKNLTFKISLIAVVSALVLVSCKDQDGDFNIFSLEDDKQLGAQVDSQIEADQSQFPIMSRSQHTAAYGHLDRITNTILNSGQITYRNDFKMGNTPH